MRASRLIVAALVLGASIVGAQDTGASSRTKPPLRPQLGRPGGAGRPGNPGPPNEQRALQARVRQAFAGVVRRQLNLDAAQMDKLRAVDVKYEQQRRAILRDERDARLNLRAAMQDSTNVDQSKIAQLMDRLVQGQRKRADLLDGEQKELGEFLTPLQRAKYFALRERMNVKLQELQDSAGAGRRRGIPPRER